MIVDSLRPYATVLISSGRLSSFRLSEAAGFELRGPYLGHTEPRRMLMLISHWRRAIPKRARRVALSILQVAVCSRESTNWTSSTSAPPYRATGQHLSAVKSRAATTHYYQQWPLAPLWMWHRDRCCLADIRMADRRVFQLDGRNPRATHKLAWLPVLVNIAVY
jgi:hypothetical protein